MTIKTFNPNRVGGGTFELEQDATTGEYKLKEVGFIKLPELKLPEIVQADPIIPPDDDDDTDDDTGGGTGGGGSSGGGGDNQQVDYTGTRDFKNIQDEATKFAKQDTGIDRTSMDQGAIQISGLREKEAYDKAVANYNSFAERNRDLAMGKQPLTEEQRLQNKVDLDAARNRMDSARKSFEDTFETVKAAPVISEDLQKFGPTTVESGTLMGTKTPITSGTFTKESIDKSFLGEEGTTTKKNILQKAADFALNKSTFKVGVEVLGGTMKTIAEAGVAIGDAILGVTEVDKRRREANSATAKALGYTTVGELGGSTDPGRIASVRLADGTIATSSADSVFVGFNRDAAKGNLSGSAAKRIETRTNIGQARVEAKYGKNSQQAKDFKTKTESFQNELNDFDNKKKEQPVTGTTKPGESGGNEGGGGGKSIVCTAMYQTTGLRDWSKAMKIWYIYQKKYLTIQHQEGYHKLFKPFVKGMHKNNIIKAIGAHFAKHRTQHLKHVMFNSKPSLLGKIYNKILEPICYWAGRK